MPTGRLASCHRDKRGLRRSQQRSGTACPCGIPTDAGRAEELPSNGRDLPSFGGKTENIASSEITGIYKAAGFPLNCEIPSAVLSRYGHEQERSKPAPLKVGSENLPIATADLRMFETLQDGLKSAMKTLRGKGKLTEGNMRDGLSLVEQSLLEADVSYSVVKEFMAHVTEKAMGEKVMLSLDPDQQLVGIVYQELIQLLGPRRSLVAPAGRDHGHHAVRATGFRQDHDLRQAGAVAAGQQSETLVGGGRLAASSGHRTTARDRPAIGRAGVLRVRRPGPGQGVSGCRPQGPSGGRTRRDPRHGRPTGDRIKR